MAGTVDGMDVSATSSSGGGMGGGRPSRQRRASTKAREMEGIDMDRIIKRISKGKDVVLPDSDDEDEDAPVAKSTRSKSKGKRKGPVVKKGESESSSSSSDDGSGSEGYETWGDEEGDNSEVEEYVRQARKRKKEREERGDHRRWVQGFDGTYYRATERTGSAMVWKMNKFTNSAPSPLLTQIFRDSLLVRDLFVTPRLLNAEADLVALGYTCKALTPLLEAARIKPAKARRYRWGRSNDEEKGLAPSYVGQEGEEVSVTVDFNSTSLAYPAKFVSGLGRPRGQQITQLTLTNLTGELCWELSDVITGPGLPNLISLMLGGSSMPHKALNSTNGGLISALFTAPHAQLPKLTALHLEGVNISTNTWKRLTALIRKTLTPALKAKRALALAPPPKPATPDGGPDTPSTAATTADASAAADAAGGKKKKKGRAKGKATKQKTPVGKVKKGAAGKGKPKPKKAATVKALLLASAPSPLLRCTDLRLTGVRLPKGVLTDLMLGWQRFRTPLTSLLLEGTRASEADLKLLAQVIEEGVFPTLVEFGVGESNLTDAMAAAMVKGLAAHCSAVKLLALATSGTHTPAPLLVKSLVAAAKGTGEGGSGPGLASSLKRLGISWPGLTNSDRDVLIPAMLNVDTTGGGAGGSQALAFPALAFIRLTDMPTLRDHLVPILKATLRRRITDLDLSFCGGNKQAVMQMVAEVKRTIPTLGLPKTQPIKLNLVQFEMPRGWGYHNYNPNHEFTWEERTNLQNGLNAKWEVKFEKRY